MAEWLRCRRGAASAVATILVAAPGTLAAQDLQVSSAVEGRPLPAGYYTRLAERPGFFELGQGWIAKAAVARAGGAAVDGALPILVVLARFADSPPATVPAADLQRILFDGPAQAGTLTEYYAEQSGGLLQVVGAVVPWVRTDLTVQQVRGGSFGLGGDARTGEFITQALAGADATTDFGAFDNDGPDGVPNSGDDDGFVDALAVEFLEASVTCAGGGPTIWAHRSRVEWWMGAPYVSDDLGPGGEPIRANDYIVQAAVRCDGRLQTTVTIAHEFGHILGLPDLYDSTEGIQPFQRNWVVGCWSIMAAGQWGCGPALQEGRWDRPPHFGPWEKAQLGWLPNVRIAGDVLSDEIVLGPVESTGEVLRLDLSPQEYLLVEYRDGSSFDVNLPATGVLVHHIDATRPSGSRRCRTCARLYEVALLEADANGSLTTPEGEGGSRGQPGDVFATDGIARLTNATTPSTRLNSGAPSDVSLYAIEVVDGTARIRFSTRVMRLDRLLERFLADEPGDLTADERAHLDDLGNRNGRYDLGDLRVYLAEHPSVLARAEGGA